MTQNYILTFVLPDTQGALMSFNCNTQSISLIYNRNQALYAEAIVTSLNYEKQLYQPSKMEVTLHIELSPEAKEGTTLSASQVREIFEQATVELSTTFTQDKNEEPTSIAKNFFVYQVTPVLRSTSKADNGNSHIEVNLLIYSMDKLFDITKGCRSYVAMRLGNDIMAKAAEFYTANSILAPEVNFGDMQFLKTNDDLKEPIQPFLVQYNETFYTMLARTANRCGEFLFFENGKLNLGVKELNTPISVTTGNETGAVLLSSIEYPSKTINPFEAITYRYQRNPQITTSYKDETQLSISISKYADLPPKDSIQKMEYAIALLKMSETKGDDGYATLINGFKKGVNDLVDEWLKANKGKGAKQAYNNLANIRMLKASIEKANAIINQKKKDKTEAENALPGVIQDVATALEEREMEQDPENWHKKDIAYQQKLAKKQELEATIEQCDAEIKVQEEKVATLKQKLKDDYGIENVDDINDEDVKYIDNIRQYWQDVLNFINKLKATTYYKLKTTYQIKDKKKDDKEEEEEEPVRPESISDKEWNLFLAEREMVKLYVKSQEFTVEIARINALIRLVPAQKGSSGDPKETRIVQDLIQGADDYFGVGAIVHGEFLDVLDCVSSKGTLIGMSYAVDKARKKKQKSYNQYAYIVSLINRFFNTTKPWLTFTIEEAVNEAMAVAHAAEIMKFTNDSYNSHFYQSSHTIKAELGPNPEFTQYFYKKGTGDKKSKRMLYSAVNNPSYEFANYKYKKRNSEGKQEETTKYEALKSYFYKLICKLQSLASEERIVLNVRTADNTKVVKLGDTISHDGKKYIVIEDKASFVARESTPQNTDVQGGEFSQRLVAIPFIENIPMPPACPQGHYGKAGSQPGFVVDNYDPDNQGRVRVIFAWQKEEKDADFTIPTPYIRVATPYATSMKGGMFFRPRVGDEVMISFEHDNPERPYVSSSLFNIDHTPALGPSANPNSTIIASHNGQSINLQDENNIAFLTSILKIPFVSDAIAMAAGADSLKDTKDGDFAGSITLTDFLGIYKISASTSSRNITISSPMGDVKINAMTGITIDAPYGDIKITGKNITLEARNKVNIVSGKAANEARKAAKDTSPWYTKLANAAKDAAASVIKKELTPDLGLIRCIMERILEPIDGTMLIKSHNYLKLEAGEGVTSFENTVNKSKVDYGNIDADKIAAMQEPQVIGLLMTYVNSLIPDSDELENRRKQVLEAIETYEKVPPTALFDFKLIIKKGKVISDVQSAPLLEWAVSQAQMSENDINDKFYTLLKTENEIMTELHIENLEANQSRMGFLEWAQYELCHRRLETLHSLYNSCVDMCMKVVLYKNFIKDFSTTNIKNEIQEELNRKIGNDNHPSNVSKVLNETILWRIIQTHFQEIGELILSDYIGEENIKENLSKVLPYSKKRLVRTIARDLLCDAMGLSYDEKVAGSMLQKISPSTKLSVPDGNPIGAAADAVAGLFSNPTLDREISDDDIIEDAKWTAWVSGWKIDSQEKQKSFLEKSFGDYLDLTKAASDVLPNGEGRAAINARQPGTILMSGSNGFMLSERDGRFKLVRTNEAIEALQEVLLKM